MRPSRRQLLQTAVTALVGLAAPRARAIPSGSEVARRYADAIVIVERTCAEGGPAGCTPGRSQGFVVASNGLLATVLPGIRVGDVVVIRGEGDEHSATAVVVDPDGLALLRLRALPASPLSALGVGLTSGRSRWLIGLSREAQGVQAVVGGEEARGLLVPVPRGAPVLNESHEVVAVALRSRGGGAIDVLPAERLRSLAARLAQQAADRGHTPPPPEVR